MSKKATVFIERAIESSIISSKDKAKAIELSSKIDLEHQHALFDAHHVIVFVGWLVANVGCLVLLNEAKNKSDELACMVATLTSVVCVVLMAMSKSHSLKFSAALATVSAVSYIFFASGFGAELLDLTSDGELLFSSGILTFVSLIFILVNGFPALILFSWLGLMIISWVNVKPIDQEVFFLHAGWITLFIAYIMNFLCAKNYTFWLNKVGLLVLALGMKEFVSPGQSIEPEYLWISISLIGISVLIGYPSYAFSGVVGLTTYMIFLIDIVYRDQRLTLGIALLGLGAVICYCATAWRKLVDTINFDGKLKPKDLPTPYMFGIE